MSVDCLGSPHVNPPCPHAVIFVTGGVSQGARDAHWELALLLDILDLILHCSATTSSADDQPQIVHSNPSTSAANLQDSVDGDAIEISKHQASAGQLHDWADCLAWGLRAVNEAAKTVHEHQACTRMLSEYVLERIVLFSRDRPADVGQIAVEVGHNLQDSPFKQM